MIKGAELVAMRLVVGMVSMTLPLFTLNLQGIVVVIAPVVFRSLQ